MPRLTLRQHKYKLNRLKGMTQYDAARLAGYSHNYATDACKIEKKVKEGLDEVFERRGLTLQAHADFLIDVMFNATDLKGKDAIEHADWTNRLKASEQIARLRGLLKDGGTLNITQNNKSLTIIVETSSENAKPTTNTDGIGQEILVDAQAVESVSPVSQ